MWCSCVSPTAMLHNNVVPGSGGIKGGGSATPCAEASASPVVEAAAASTPPPPQRQHQRAQRNVGPSSSSSASQSFTQWRLPVHHPPQASSSASASASGAGSRDALLSAEEKFAAGEVVAALRAVEREMEAAARPVPAGVVAGVVAAVREPATARLAAKVLLVVLLEEGNMETAVEAGAASAAVEAVAASGPAGATAERALRRPRAPPRREEGEAGVRGTRAAPRNRPRAPTRWPWRGGLRRRPSHLPLPDSEVRRAGGRGPSSPPRARRAGAPLRRLRAPPPAAPCPAAGHAPPWPLNMPRLAPPWPRCRGRAAVRTEGRQTRSQRGAAVAGPGDGGRGEGAANG
ncbi:translation initiation factor IF-2-like [Panicum virgatum]|uniref:translation initiation factor IF-2-like n=1 Tax=Panicum virgatum TaxID=38727 RepID=UPI0019D5ED84|nr:translation initiation factor IF-2-like [Panicum virgatum]